MENINFEKIKNIFAIGLNYNRHASEIGATIPKWPVVFMKPTSSLIYDGDDIPIPACSTRGPELDFEGELAVIIGKAAKDVLPEEALNFVKGYTICNDVSARRWQKHAGANQWIKGKGFDGFCPLGPKLAMPHETGDPQNLGIVTRVNSKVMQDSNTGDMIFPIKEIISYLSQDTTLLPGTVILTGTPEGVGFVRNPRLFLKPGDVVEVEIENIGTLTNRIIRQQ